MENTIFLGNKEFTILYNKKSFINDIFKKDKKSKIEDIKN